MEIQIGNPVRGEKFFNRAKLTQDAWSVIETGAHILITAPRRVGKTSLMLHLEDNPKEGYSLLYITTESANSENEFFRKIVNRVLKTDHITKSQKIVTFLEKNMPSIKRIGPEGVEIEPNKDNNYHDILIRVLESLKEESKKLIIMIDEFPETLENIVKDNGERAGITFLQSNRELRHNTEITKSAQFIYTGSIGLENIVSRMNAVKTINDLARLKITPLSQNEATELTYLLLEDTDFEIKDNIVDYMLKKIEWLIPFYIQLVIYEIKEIHRNDNLSEITEQTVDSALYEMLGQRNHFEHWHARLRSLYKEGDYKFVREVLDSISENDQLGSNEIFNIAVKYLLENSYKELLNTLVYDGYINNNENPKIYRYNSPVLRMWWRQNVAN